VRGRALGIVDASSAHAGSTEQPTAQSASRSCWPSRPSTPDRAWVHTFHAGALGAGGQDNGAPGVRTMYQPNSYGAFVLDPDGINVEAVCHAAE
jgi:catechol 2,3-dioxygenase-like lactoylglutathione lyase family enzyme